MAHFFYIGNIQFVYSCEIWVVLNALKVKNLKQKSYELFMGQSLLMYFPRRCSDMIINSDI